MKVQCKHSTQTARPIRGLKQFCFGFIMSLTGLSQASAPVSSNSNSESVAAPAPGVYFVVSGSEDMEIHFESFGKAVAPAGGKLDKNSGHHHLIIDGGPIGEGKVIPTDDKHLHFGKAQTSAKVKLQKGRRKLTLQFADGAHRSFGPEWSSTIFVDVK